MLKKQKKRKRRKKRIRTRTKGVVSCPRLCLFRSNKHIYGQLIDDEKGKTILSVSDAKAKKGKKTEIAKQMGKLLAEKASSKKISKVVFDRGGYQYHGRVKAFAEGAREGGLKF